MSSGGPRCRNMMTTSAAHDVDDHDDDAAAYLRS